MRMTAPAPALLTQHRRTVARGGKHDRRAGEEIAARPIETTYSPGEDT